MKAHLRSVRIAPKKLNLIAKMVRGMAVADAVEALRMTHKKAARLIEGLLRSSIANTSHNLKQDPQTMIIKTIVVNQGQAFHRGVPKARGQVRPIKKFLSHISIELGFPDLEDSNDAKDANDAKEHGRKDSQKTKKAVTKHSSSSDSSASSASSASSK